MTKTIITIFAVTTLGLAVSAKADLTSVLDYGGTITDVTPGGSDMDTSGAFNDVGNPNGGVHLHNISDGVFDPAGVTDPTILAGYSYLTNTQVETGSAGATIPVPTIVFDLGADTLISSYQIWNYRNGGTTANMLDDYTLSFATEAEGTAAFAIVSSIADIVGTATTANTDGEQAITPVTVRYIQFKLQSRHGGKRVGVEEIQFDLPSVTDIVAPAAPTGLAGIPGHNVANLDWVDNVESDLASYRVYRQTGGGGFSQIGTSATSDYSDATALNGVTYDYYVTAVDSSNNESTVSNTDMVTPVVDTGIPVVPTGLVATAGNGTVSLDWDDNGESDLALYRIYRATTASDFKFIGTVTSSAFTDVGLHNRVTYLYKITAEDLGGNESTLSSAVFVFPDVPDGPGGPVSVKEGTHFEDFVVYPHLKSLPADDVADSDGDGELDLAEFKIGQDAFDPNSRGQTQFQIAHLTGAAPSFTYHERISSPGVHAAIRYSTDLSTWSSTSISELSRTVLPDGNTEEVTVQLDEPALLNGKRVFVRIEISNELYQPRFVIVPEATTQTTVSMTAGEADLDPRIVEYFFEATSAGGNDSGWQSNRLYTDASLTAGQTYTYRVKLRQVSAVDGTPVPASETAWSRSASATTPTTGTRPNIIVFMADDVGYECFDIFGDSDHDTPNITQMAAEGMKFTNYHSQPLCTPSRVQIMSGQYNHRNVTTFGNYEPDKSFATFFRQAGYKTCIAGKWQLNYRTSGDPATNPALPQRIIDLGFDEFLLWNISGGDPSYYGSRYWSPKLYTNPATPGGNFSVINGTSSQYGPTLVRDFINNFATTAAADGDPFFIYCPLVDPHDPFVTPPGFSGLSGNKAKHQAMVKYMDASVGATLDLVRNTPALANNTLVIFTGDNGTNTNITTLFNGANYQGGKAGTFDPGTHVPFVAWGPGILAGSASDDLADMTDILPTICDIAGVPFDQDYVVDGHSLRSQFSGRSRDPRRWVYGYYYDSRNPSTRRTAWVRNKHFKLYQNGLDHTGTPYVGATKGNMYDVINDNRETSPLVTPPIGSRLEALRTELQAVLDRMDSDDDPGNN